MASMKWTQAEVDFATEVANKTGADFYTIFGWELAEGGPPDNPLNIGPGKHFGTPVKAADATAHMLETSSYYKDILKSFQGKYGSEDKAIAAQAKAIAYNPHWNVININPDTGKPYSAAQIQVLRKQYLSNISGNALKALYEGVAPNAKITTTGDVIPPPDQNPFGDPFHVDEITGAIGTLAHDIAYPFEWLQKEWERVFLLIGGAILIILAIVLIGKQQANTFTFGKGGG